MSRWVEDEIILPSGPHKGEPFRHRLHPISRIWFDAIDSGKWSRFALTGPTQNGKTLMGYVAPVLYHLMELRENVIIGLPDMRMAGDKWRDDFEPVIQASGYSHLLPDRGDGSRGGSVKSAVRFRNGAELRFMSAGGSDKARAGKTTRVLAITETDGMDAPGEASREADKIEQLEARTRAFGRHGKRVYLECTVSIEAGRIWQELTNGTDSRLYRPCPHCGEYVAPEREHLTGWQHAASEAEAADLAHWVCPACSAPWSDEERRLSSSAALLVHHGQAVDRAGVVSGDPPRTQTFGLRWSAVDNPFTIAADLGAEEWKASRAFDHDNAEKKMRQFVWCVPWDPPDMEITPLDPAAIAERFGGTKRGIIPADTVAVTVGVDTNKRRLHWVAYAARQAGGGTIIEYGSQEVESERLGTRRGLVEAFQRLGRYFDAGWGGVTPSQVWIDSGYHEHTDAVYEYCSAMPGSVYRPTKGYGEGQQHMTRYFAPQKGRDNDVVFLGKQLHVSRVRRNGRILQGVALVHVNADAWKSELREALAMPPDADGAVLLYEAGDSWEHSEFSQHITAERQIEKFFPARGAVVCWEKIRRENHYLDAAYAAMAAASVAQTMQAQVTGAKSLAEMAAAAGVR